MEFSFLCSFFFIFPVILHKFAEAGTPEYEECKKPFLCGTNNVNLSYPFFDGQTRPSYCGYPGFQIDCSRLLPQMSMLSDTYYLLSMNTDTVTIASKNYYSYDGFCPQNLNINSSLYKFSSTNDDITIFYGCSTNTFTVNLFSCKNVSNNNYQTAYYTTPSSGSSQAQNLNDTCNSSVVFPIQHQFLADQSSTIIGYLTGVFHNGFGLEWIAENDLCDGCQDSGGKCGYKAAMNKFACYCTDGTYDSDCNGNKSKSSKTVVIGVAVGGGLVAALLAGCLFIIRRRKRVKRLHSETTPREPRLASVSTDPPSSNEFHSSQDYTTSSSNHLSPSMPSYPSSKSNLENNSSYFGVNLFSYSELEEATENFNKTRELGDGGFGAVYYGVLHDGRVVAVKRLYENSNRRMGQFMNEVQILARLRHDNLVILHGCTSRSSRDLLLVYEYIPNGTVADHLNGKHSVSKKLTWPIRLSIAVETAEALSFLHDNDVIHRDVKTTNILLDNNFKVKVADFGLSRLFPIDATHVSTAPQGTPGYVDPSYYQCFRLTEKSDVYSFGVVLVELISSKLAVDVNRQNQDINLALMAMDRIQKRALNELIDPHLGYDEDYAVQKSMKLTAELAFQCLQHDREMRPSMKEVLGSLKEIQTEMVNVEKQVVVDIQESDDDARLLKNDPPFSPE